MAKCLNRTSGSSLNDALLEHLAVQREDAKKRKIPAIHALEGLEQSRESPSLGALDLPVEIVQNIISQLSLPDLRNFKAVNSCARSMVVSSYQYRDVITYGSEVISTLYKTELHSIFPLIRIYEVLTQGRCVACDRFGGYVFLPGLQRCCERCARYDPELIPIRTGTATTKHKTLVREAREKIPMMLWVAGDEMAKLPRSRSLITMQTARRRETPTETLYLVSSANAAWIYKVPNKSSGHVRMPCTERHKYSWHQAAVPIPHLEPRTQIVTRGYRCKGCTRAIHSGTIWHDERPHCYGCQLSMPNGLDINHANTHLSRPKCHQEHAWNASQGAISCRIDIANGRLYTRDELLVHLAECAEAQSLLADLGRLDKRKETAVALPKREGKTKRPRLANYYKY